jgi:sugar (pentulose or hexulose) kinase
VKSDMMEFPIAVVNQSESGTRGAALLAGLAFGVFHDIAEATGASVDTIRIHEPDRRRAALHSERDSL